MTETDKQKVFLEALFGEARGDAKRAKEIAGYSPDTPTSVILNSKAVKEKLKDRGRDLLAEKSAKALYTMIDAMEEESMLGRKERMAAAKDLLDRYGLVKTDQVEVKSDTPLFILPAKKDDD